MYHNVFSVVIVIFVSLSFQLFCSCRFFVVLANAIIIAYRFLLLLSLFRHGCCYDHYYRCQSGCCYYYYYCSYYIVVTSIASLLWPLSWFLDFIKFKFTLNFRNYLFGSAALFYFILQGIK